MKFDELMHASKIGELLHQKEREDKKSHTILCVLAIIGTIAAIAGIVYAVYRYLTPDYLEDFEDDFEDEFIDDLEDDFVDEEL